MPVVFSPLKRRFALYLLSSLLASTAYACPSGQTQVCVVSCVCLPGTQDEVGALMNNVNQLAAAGLASWLVQAHRSAQMNPLQSIPLSIRVQLMPFYSEQLLDLVRYQVGADSQLNAANAMLQNPDVNAVTLQDIIVFRHVEDAQNNLELWAHEMKHIEQYQQWGVEEFAQRYTRDYRTVEAPAYAMQTQLRHALRASAAAAK